MSCRCCSPVWVEIAALGKRWRGGTRGAFSVATETDLKHDPSEKSSLLWISEHAWGELLCPSLFPRSIISPEGLVNRADSQAHQWMLRVRAPGNWFYLRLTKHWKILMKVLWTKFLVTWLYGGESGPEVGTWTLWPAAAATQLTLPLGCEKAKGHAATSLFSHLW